MFFSIAPGQRPWVAVVFGILGTVCELTGHHDVAVALITAAVTIATLAEVQKDPPKIVPPPLPPALPGAKIVSESKPE